ncbi:MAG: IS200/IS605 family transposase [bacterium]|nr:IS200/IS605 family transposase [bacterium]
MQEELFTTIRELVAQKRGVLIEIDGAPDHVHLLVAIAPDVALVDFLRSVKSESARWMVRHCDAGLPFAWQRGYGAFSVSLSQMPVVTRYIQGQRTHHQTISFADEFRKLLEEHGLVLRDST